MTSNHRVFLGTSVILSAVLSGLGGARELFCLGEAGVIQLIVGRNVLRECEEVVRCKVPVSLPNLANLLKLGLIEIAPHPLDNFIEETQAFVVYPPDTHVLAEAMGVEPDWFVTHDKEHF